MDVIQSIRVGDKEFKIYSQELKDEIDSLKYQLKQSTRVSIGGYDEPLEEAINYLHNEVGALKERVAILEIEHQLAANANESAENPNKKFDLEIFRVIEVNNPFLQNLI